MHVKIDNNLLHYKTATKFNLKSDVRNTSYRDTSENRPVIEKTTLIFQKIDNLGLK